MKARKSKFRIFALAAAYVWSGYLLLEPSWVFSQAPFYQGKTITVISGQEPGGTGDRRLKALLHYLRHDGGTTMQLKMLMVRSASRGRSQEIGEIRLSDLQMQPGSIAPIFYANRKIESQDLQNADFPM